ncbi:hypothetical protein V1J52_04920 [Streptomyces sp. TRM 70351]|uniref:hypothetical protein n=1 Tax=Streptomyces sp. TRM 70351 TaxID=3116552 RepID=UPI002E7B9EE8|nr:hypothetical protein [Streptomyces sp. TRM 70351]MEE1927535.1 hypothetical protein [Streptomyces sp. TRM 70351]
MRRTSTRNLTRSALAAATSAAALLMTVPSASAVPTSYESDACSSANNRYCFEIYYNSHGATTGYSYSACFVANKSIPDHYGYSPNGAVLVRYVYRGGQLPNHTGCDMASGSGLGIKNNAASAANNECGVSNRIYYNSGYQGTYETFPAGCGSYWPASNLKSSLKNENASHKRL